MTKIQQQRFGYNNQSLKLTCKIIFSDMEIYPVH